MQGYYYPKGEVVSDGDRIGTIVKSRHSHWHSLVKWDGGTTEPAHTDDLFVVNDMLADVGAGVEV